MDAHGQRAPALLLAEEVIHFDFHFVNLIVIILGHLHVLQWVIANGCPYDYDATLHYAIRGKHAHVEEWIRSAVKPRVVGSLLR